MIKCGKNGNRCPGGVPAPTMPVRIRSTLKVITPQQHPPTMTPAPGKTNTRSTKRQPESTDGQYVTRKTTLNQILSTVVPASKLTALTAGQNPNGPFRSDESTSYDNSAARSEMISMPLLIVSAVAGVCFLCALTAVVYACHARKRSKKNKGNTREANNGGNTAMYIPVGEMTGTTTRGSNAENPTYAEIGDHLLTRPPLIATYSGKELSPRSKHRLGSATTLPLISHEAYPAEFSPTLPPPRQTYEELDVSQQIIIAHKSKTLAGGMMHPRVDYRGYMIPSLERKRQEDSYLELIPEDGSVKEHVFYYKQPTIPYDQKALTLPSQSQPSDANAYLPLIMDNPKGYKGDGYVDVDYKSHDEYDAESRKIPSAPVYEGSGGSFYFTVQNQVGDQQAPIRLEGENNTIPVDPECQVYSVLENSSIPGKVNGGFPTTHIEENQDSESQEYYVLEKDSLPEKLTNGHHTEQPRVKFTSEGNTNRPGDLDVSMNLEDPYQTRIAFTKQGKDSGGMDNSVGAIRDENLRLCTDKGNNGEIDCYQQLPLLTPTEEDTQVYSKLNRGFTKNTLQK